MFQAYKMKAKEHINQCEQELVYIFDFDLLEYCERIPVINSCLE